MANIQTTGKDLKGLLENPSIKNRLEDILGKNAATFSVSIVQIASQSKMLAEAEPNSIVGAAMTAASLRLPLSNSLGQAYIVPFKEKQKDGTWITKGQFMLGYKGLKQLAIRSNQYLEMYQKKVFEGQYIEDESFKGFHFSWKDKKSDKVIGYASYYKLVNGFSSWLYMTDEELTKHGKKFSQTFKKNFGQWVDDEEKMKLKTVTKLHLNSGEAPISIEMQTAIETDQAVNTVNEKDGTIDLNYPDNEEVEIDPNAERIMTLINNIENQEDIDFTREHVTEEYLPAFKKKIKEINEQNPQK